MISFAIITDTPVRLRDFLVARDVIELNSKGNYVGVRPGMEWVRVPNPIMVDGVPDDRAVFLVKFAHESESERAASFRDWIVANSSVVSAPGNYLINGVHAGSARKVTGENVWLVHIDPDRFGVWQ
jgi:hypothetical protein